MLSEQQVDLVQWDGKSDIQKTISTLRSMAEDAESPDEARLVIRRIAQISR